MHKSGAQSHPRATKFCTAAPTILSINTAVFFSVHTKMCIVSHTHTHTHTHTRNTLRRIIARFKALSRIVGPQSVNCLTFPNILNLQWFKRFLNVTGPSPEGPFEIASNEGFGVPWQYINRLRCVLNLGRHHYTTLGLQDRVIW